MGILNGKRVEYFKGEWNGRDRDHIKETYESQYYTNACAVAFLCLSSLSCCRQDGDPNIALASVSEIEESACYQG